MNIHFNYCICFYACVVYHFNLYHFYFNGVWNKPFHMDNSLSVIRSVEVMSDHVCT